jgi:PAS domain S-box-containing protein
LRAPDGSYRWTNLRAVPLRDRDGRIEKWIAINVDIDARKQAEAGLKSVSASWGN